MSVRTVVDEKNRSLALDGRMRIGLGVMLSGFMFFVVFLTGCVVAMLLLPGRMISFPLAFTLVFMAAAIWSAWREVDPLAALPRLTEADEIKRSLEQFAASQLGGGMAMALQRRSLAGFATFLIAGPRSILDGWKLLRERIPDNPGLMSRAQELLERCATPIPLDRVPAAAESVLLCEFLLVKVRAGPGGKPRLERTEAGRQAAEGGG